jgi:hypothetical protein
MADPKTDKPTIEECQAAAKAAADPDGICSVTALIEGVTNHGVKYAKGVVFPMEHSLAAVHAWVGQVRIDPQIAQIPAEADKAK